MENSILKWQMFYFLSHDTYSVLTRPTPILRLAQFFCSILHQHQYLHPSIDYLHQYFPEYWCWWVPNLSLTMNSKEKLLISKVRLSKYIWILTLSLKGPISHYFGAYSSVKLLSRPRVTFISKAKLSVAMIRP